MHRSSWDMEVYAKHVQERRVAEAAWQRLVDEAMAARAEAVFPFALGIARFVSTVKGWLSANRAQPARRVDEPDWLASDIEPALIPEIPRPSRQALPSRSPQPYADMVVIARGPRTELEEQPSVVRDC